MNSVRILNKHPDGAKNASPPKRAKPVQSRSQVTVTSLQEAFVRILVEQGYEQTTIREVVSVAGVGIGTFYDYYPNLRALAAATINNRCKESATLLQATVIKNAGQPAAVMVKAILNTLIHISFSRPKEWHAFLLLERQISSAQALQKIHEQFTHMWAEAFRLSSTKTDEGKIPAIARMAHALSYGWYSQDLLFYLDNPIHAKSIDDLALSIAGFTRPTSLSSVD
jgi:AcrR family transcriptional regulator